MCVMVSDGLSASPLSALVCKSNSKFSVCFGLYESHIDVCDDVACQQVLCLLWSVRVTASSQSALVCMSHTLMCVMMWPVSKSSVCFGL